MGYTHPMAFTQTWFDNRKEEMDRLVTPLKGLPVSFLEIGCFEGRSTVWFLEHVLTHADAMITVVDTFEGSVEMDRIKGDIEGGKLLDRFLTNIGPWAEKVDIWKGDSKILLVDEEPEQFDFIYVDGSHDEIDVYFDGKLSWPLLKHGGLIAFDDYALDLGEHCRPRNGIDRFFKGLKASEYEVLYAGSQLHARKK